MRVERVACAVAAAATASLLCIGPARAQPKPERLATCESCHGPAGNAQVAQFPSLAGQPKVFIEHQLVMMREGLRDVPAMKEVMAGITDAQIVALANHYAALPSVPANAPVDPHKYRAGEETARKMLCGTCHLADYAGQNQVPRLAGQNEEYLFQSMKQLRDNPGPGRDTIMAAALHGLSDADLANVAHYLARFKR
jgi:cytochrome c553